MIESCEGIACCRAGSRKAFRTGIAVALWDAEAIS